MTIDWTRPVETTEDLPRPVRVLAIDCKVLGCPIVLEVGSSLLLANTEGNVWRAMDGNIVQVRNVPPPKPEPVQYEGWIRLYAKDGHWPTATTDVYSSEDRAYDFHLRKPLAICKIAWMSDGSPVPRGASGEDDLAAKQVVELAERYQDDVNYWKAKAEALQAEVDRLGRDLLKVLDERNDADLEIRGMQPVVEAAAVWVEFETVLRSPSEAALFEAVRTYQSQQAPATVGDVLDGIRNRLGEPVKNCTTCRWNVERNICTKGLWGSCIKAEYGNWEPRHD